MVAQNNKTPVDSLDKLAKDNDATVRLSVAHNSSCPINTLKRLIEDENKNIRDIAKLNLLKIDLID